MITLGIVNTYDKIKIIDAHYRAIARAAPICYTFGFKLALYDFPFKMNEDELVKYVTEKTTVGDSGNYLKLIHKKKHLFLFDLSKKGFQSQFGTVVITTSKPEKKRFVRPHEIADGILKKKSFLILVGLGRKGLPKELFEHSPLHLDITSAGISLETCTAIGCIPAYIMGIVHTKEK